MKVYKGTIDGEHRVLIATNSLTEAARKLSMEPEKLEKALRQGTSHHEKQIALKEPETMFIRGANGWYRVLK